MADDLAQTRREIAARIDLFEQADTALLICVSANGMPWRAMAMFIAVRMFGWVRYRA